ncbi:ER-resident thioredoxin [Trichoderma longibrachiatum ATCC 18648]|uniref:ER-resident thioredoxin n=1 Tax=Trichoderma longibrachiatum ATCC 18648 TaxID=983965 RepID=A0A2T4C2P8_TRILO|nr:ER-resident thioredoxin [Trichoderma longibrachiatum ATCC 18648]
MRSSLSSIYAYGLLAFVAPKLETSKALLKEWQTVQQNVASTATIDCPSSPKLCQEMDVVSFPAIRLYQKDGSMKRYRGSRRAAAIESFVKRALEPSVQDIPGQQLAGFIASDDFVFIAKLLGESESINAHYRVFADEYSDRYSFGITTSDSLASNGVWCYNNVDGTQHAATDLNDPNALKKLLNLCTAEIIPQLTRRNEMTHLSSGRSLVYYFSNNEADREAYVKSLKPVAQRYAEFLQFVTVDSREYPDMPRNLGVRSAGGLAVQNVHNGQIFPFRGDAALPGQIDQFIVAISEGRAQPWDGRFDQAEEAHDEL